MAADSVLMASALLVSLFAALRGAAFGGDVQLEIVI